MTKKEKEILAVLDLPEKNQRKWLLVNIFGERILRESTADLAFRLRDEVIDKYGVYAWREAKEVMGLFGNKRTTDKWWQEFAQPIYWIVAALLAKEKVNE